MLSPNEDTLEPNDTFKQMEYLCDESFSRPKIFLNDFPMDISINGAAESDPAKKQHNTSFLSSFNNPITTTTTTTSVQLYKSYAKRDTVYTSYAASDADTKSSAYFSDTSHFLCKSHEDGYEFPKFDSIEETSANSSGYNGSMYKLRDTLDECNFRRHSQQQLNLKEPSTPIKRTFSGQRLDILGNDSIDLSVSSGRFSYSNNYETAADDLDGMQVMHELETSMYNMTTSSPIIDMDRSIAVNEGDNGSGDADDGCAKGDDDEPVDLNNTLERVNHILAKGGFKTPSPTRMVRRKHLMKEYVSKLFQRESFQKQINNAMKKPIRFFPTPKTCRSNKRKPIKRTISVDDSLKLLHPNTPNAAFQLI